MNLSSQVSSLEPSKRLKELGVKQESLFYWSASGVASTTVDWTMKLCRFGQTFNEETRFSAFTVAELGEMLPKESKSAYLVSTPSRSSGWNCGYLSYDTMMFMESAATEADARAKMLIYLLENNLITI